MNKSESNSIRQAHTIKSVNRESKPPGKSDITNRQAPAAKFKRSKNWPNCGEKTEDMNESYLTSTSQFERDRYLDDIVDDDEHIGSHSDVSIRILIDIKQLTEVSPVTIQARISLKLTLVMKFTMMDLLKLNPLRFVKQ